MAEDLRCCGTGTCLINAEGICWCGQRWDGTKMCFPDKPHGSEAVLHDNSPDTNTNSSATPAGSLPDASPANPTATLPL